MSNGVIVGIGDQLWSKQGQVWTLYGIGLCYFVILWFVTVCGWKYVLNRRALIISVKVRFRRNQFRSDTLDFWGTGVSLLLPCLWDRSCETTEIEKSPKYKWCQKNCWIFAEKIDVANPNRVRILLLASSELLLCLKIGKSNSKRDSQTNIYFIQSDQQSSLGSGNHKTSKRTRFFTPEACQMTEIYEYRSHLCVNMKKKK